MEVRTLALRPAAGDTIQSEARMFAMYVPPAMMEPTYYVNWGALTLINAGLAQGKGRSGLAWFLLSILLGPFATFLIVILPRTR